MTGVIYIDRQHSGKPSPGQVMDLGARCDLDEDGAITVLEQEAMLTGYIALHAEARLRELGHIVVPISDGHYRERHRRVNAYAALLNAYRQVYVAMHLNAGGGTYGAVFFDARSNAGPDLARAIADVLETTCDELSTGVKVIGARVDNWTAAAFSTLAGVGRPVGICYEPAFLDQPMHAPLFESQGLRRLGAALAEGINNWLLDS